MAPLPMRLLYSLCLYLATPLILLYFGWRGLRDRHWWQGWSERFAWRAPDGEAGGIVVHASSVGEVNAAAPLIEALLADSGQTVTVSSFTPTGRARAGALFGGRVATVYAPLDLPGATRRFFARHRPALLLIIETEIWPNWLRAAAAGGVPVMIANASISTRSTARYRRAGRLASDALASVSCILAQGEADLQRFRDCGARDESLCTGGQLKFDQAVSDAVLEAARVLRAAWGGRPVWVAGSTHAADEAVVFDAFDTVLRSFPDCLLVLAPRHPERFDAVAASATARFRTARRSQDVVAGDSQCLLLDTLGELPTFYASADLAFVGGSFSPVGGHNVLEPAALGLPVLTGPHTGGITDVLDRLLAAGGAIQADDADALANQCIDLLSRPGSRAQMAESARQAVEAGRGALRRNLEAALQLIR